MANKLPADQRELMDQLVSERWIMLTLDTEVDTQTGVGEAVASKTWERLTADLSYMASRLAGDGFEGATDTRDVVDPLMETIGDTLVAYAVKHRLATATPEALAAAS